MFDKDFQKNTNDRQKSTYKCPHCKSNVIIPSFKESATCKVCKNTVIKEGLKSVYEIALITRLKNYWKRKENE